MGKPYNLNEMEELDRRVKEFYDTIGILEFFPENWDTLNIDILMAKMEEYYDVQHPELLPDEFEGYIFNFWDKYMFINYLTERYGIGIRESTVTNLFVVNTVKYADKNTSGLEIIGPRILTISDYVQYQDNIPYIDNNWWFMPEYIDSYPVYFENNKFINDIIPNSYGRGVRPALIINSASSNLEIGDKFTFKELSFTIIGKNIAICDTIIDEVPYRYDYCAKDYRNFNKSVVKKCVVEWFNSN